MNIQHELEGFEKYFYWTFNIFLLIVTLIFLILITMRLLKELRSKFMDLITLLQYIIILIYSGTTMTYSILWISDIKLNMFSLFTIIDGMVNLYFTLNLFSWFIMVFHIDKLNRVTDDPNIVGICNHIKRVEKLTFFTILAVLLTHIVISIVGLTVSSFFYSDKYYHSVNLTVMLIFIVSLIVLYIKLVKTLKRNKINLMILMSINFLNFVLFLIVSILGLSNAYDKINNDMNGFNTFERVAYSIFTITINLNIFFVFYFNIRNINFKEYLRVTYEGLTIGHHFQNASIFTNKLLIQLYHIQ